MGTPDALAPAYRYRATTLRVIDGDTYEFDIDLGVHVHVHETVRYFGYSARESNTPEGVRATVAAADILMFSGNAILIETHKDVQTFARFLAVVYVNGTALHELIPEHLTPGVHRGTPHA